MANGAEMSKIVDANPQELEAQENTQLLASGQSPDNTDDAGSDATGTSQQLLLEEVEKPWPATFERSISLLASPILNARQVDHFTKSPKAGLSSLAATRLERGSRTPEASLIPPRGSSDDNFQKGVAKVHSLDFQYGSNKKDLKSLTDIQQQKAQQAQKYRQELLKEKGEKMARRKEREELYATKSTVQQSVFNMSNILMGVGLLGLPYAFRSAGWLGGSAVLLGFGFVTWRTSALIGRELNGDPRPSSYFDDSPFKTPLPPGSGPRARMREPIKSFPDIARQAFGEVGCTVLSIILYFELFSCVVIFLVAIGDHMHALFPVMTSNQHIALAAAISLVPSVVLKTARLLSYFSLLGTLATIAIVLSVIADSLAEGDIIDVVAEKEGFTELEAHHPFFRASGLPMALGIIAYCFSGHAIVPSIYTSMKKPQKFERMIDYTYVIVVGACLGVAGAGFYMYGPVVEDQVTLSLERFSRFSSATTFLTWLMIITAYSKVTLTIFPLALGMEEIFAPYLPSDGWMELTSALIKLVLIILSWLTAVCVPSFGFVCAIVGLLCTISVSVIFPAAAHLKLFNRKLSAWEKIMDWLFIIVGVIAAVVGTIATVGSEI